MNTDEVVALIRGGAEPLKVVRAAVLARVASSPQLAAADHFVIDDADDISRAAHFQVWLSRRLQREIMYGAPDLGVPWGLLVELYAPLFEEHQWGNKLKLAATGEVVGC